MTIVRFYFLAFLLLSGFTAQRACPVVDDSFNSISNNYVDDLSLTKDNRIRTYIYNPNEVYLLVLHFGFQSHIEFAKNEEIQNIILGDAYAWKITPLANRLFIKPLEKDIRTNMTIITNKRTYEFDIASTELMIGNERDLVYVIKFYYPKKNSNYMARF
ncbi:TrbG/VirB9 family P-type conjugative transfer protein [Rickettsia typhi]|uniref:VirB9 protein of the type IV secretion system n=3 Tax=Rickettsia typhi TaxID=785 RepID=Q68X81_RICTY|nr:TrbG/VirB9 family P-type conjugative transfer protein [Rickettsia typhi]AAN05403.1 putative VirB9 protein precursor [Rickettsia typhi str. Wilmington]AAU03761.1 VirB9 protein precursor of the type IV secretion system [Rickettsia typhi str. Wilmington]AFE54138.1 VirB9 protein precursor of the type IV secretion system [Rickettsia typhi str. TH1527]AFE54977.1 VirB9 protein precursor of the type IV secretion system [Rickettsia typhi str. B9991CWPP]